MEVFGKFIDEVMNLRDVLINECFLNFVFYVLEVMCLVVMFYNVMLVSWYN